VKNIWIYLSAFGICFAAMSWSYEIADGQWQKGAYAAGLGLILYSVFRKKV